jgi:D-alanyl-D-alanine carboxypeptidase/D-alanyl-D-alanine-endopeptidase (penicillin-binding protein 4)
VRKISGDIVADKRYLGAEDVSLTGRSPLSVSRSAIVVRVRPGASVNARPIVVYEPAVEGITIANRATTTAKGRSRISVTVGTQGGRISIDVSGRISIRQAGVVFRRRPSTPLLYAAALLAQSLNRRGVKITGAPLVREGFGKPAGEAVTTPAMVLAVHQSAPLPELMRPINKNSNNEYADRLLETLGAQMYGGAPSMDKGVRALRSALAELGVPDAAYHSTNGSGLGHANRISPEALSNLLRKLYFDPRIGPELMQSLSVGGVDGTTRHRFTGSVASHRVRAKTGTLNGKSCLSGYVGDESEILIFSIMVDRMGSRGVNSVRKEQVRVVETLMGYAKGLVGDAAEERPDPGTDFEAGEDVIETEEAEPAPTAPAADDPPAGPLPDPGGA